MGVRPRELGQSREFGYRYGVRLPPTPSGTPEAPPKPSTSETDDTRSAPGTSPHVWVSTTYFAEGYPYTIVNNVADALFKSLGASLGAIGLTSLFHLPWNLKFLWGPLVDRFETKRRWLVAMELACAAVLLGLAFVSTGAEMLAVISALFLLLGVLSATNDIAIDGFYMEGLDSTQQSKFIGYRAMAYKIASLVARGPLLVLVGVVGWRTGLFAAALLMGGVALLHAWLLPHPEARRHGIRELLVALFGHRILAFASLAALAVVAERHFRVLRSAWEALREGWMANPLLAPVGDVFGRITVSGWIALSLLLVLLVAIGSLPWLKRRMAAKDSYYGAAYVSFLEQHQVGRVLAFVILFRTGESFLQKMKLPFLLGEMGMSLEEYGLAAGTVGVVASFAATLLGGRLIARQGLRRWVWPFVLAQNTLNLLYVGLALGFRDATPSFGLLTAVIALEEIGAGFGTAVFMVYLMRCCQVGHKAAHFAILTALMSLSFTFAGVLSGFMAEALGFATYFGFTFLATVPMMALIPLVPRLEEPDGGR